MTEECLPIRVLGLCSTTIMQIRILDSLMLTINLVGIRSLGPLDGLLSERRCTERPEKGIEFTSERVILPVY